MAHLRCKKRPGTGGGNTFFALPDIRGQICRGGSAARAQPSLSTVTAALNIHESKLEDSHLTRAHGVSPLGRSHQRECLLTLGRSSPYPSGNLRPLYVISRFMAAGVLALLEYDFHSL